MLLWLKSNNRYYEDIIIDDDIIRSLPENGAIFNRLQQIQGNNTIEEITDEDESGDETISRTFVPASPPTQREVEAIDNALDRIQSNNSAISP